MKLGDVLKKERERKGIHLATVAAALGLETAAYEAIEAGTDDRLEESARLIVRFNQLIGGQVGQLYYPCGIPFSEIEDYQTHS